MSNYQIHTIASAPENSKPGLEQLRQAFGVIPNIAAAIANSPKLINSLVGVFQQVHSSSLSESEIQIVLLTDAVANSSTYAVAFHTALAHKQGVSSAETGAIRDRRAPSDKRFAALSVLAKTLIEKRGHLSEQDLGLFIAAGSRKTGPGGYRYSGGLDDHQLRWNYHESTAGRSLPAARLAGVTAVNEPQRNLPLVRLRFRL